MMTLDQLRIFIVVAELQHLTKAAAALSLTPSAVSSSIKALEEKYDTPLFDRVGRGIALNDAGSIFLLEARRTLASARAAELTLEELSGLQRGTLRIHASQTIASYWLPQLLVRFCQAHAAIDLLVTVDNTHKVAEAVLQGQADLGFVEGVIAAPALVSEAVASDELVAVVAPGHPWAAGQSLQRADLLGARWVLREPGSGTRSVFKQALQELGIDIAELDVALSLPSNEAVRSAVIAGNFVTAVSALVVSEYLKAGLLARANLPLAARDFSMLRHGERYQTKASLAFGAMVRLPQP